MNSSIPVPEKSFWKGPLEDGITYSLLCDFMNCRDRFWMKAVKGVVEESEFNHMIEYGSMFHNQLEYAHTGDYSIIQNHIDSLTESYPSAEDQILRWYAICQKQVEVYFTVYPLESPTIEPAGKTYREQYEQWGEPLLRELDFRIPYQISGIPSTITLRGKIDGINYIYDDRRNIVYLFLQENKTANNRIPKDDLIRTHHHSLQVLVYITALSEIVNDISTNLEIHPSGLLRESVKILDALSNQGVSNKAEIKFTDTLYNVIRRPLSKGKHSISQRKGRKKDKSDAETQEQFIERLQKVIWDHPEDFFQRWKKPINQGAVDRIKKQTLHPILSQLIHWWNWVCPDGVPKDPWRLPSAFTCNKQRIPNSIPGAGIHYRYPWGVFNPFANEFKGDYFDYYTKGLRSNLVPVKSLFSELEP